MSDKGLILVVDDVPQNLQVLRTALQKEGYRIAAANNGQVALRFLQKEIPDLILLDVMMPEINGFEVCRQIKSQPAFESVSVIFLTARTEVEDVIAGFDAGGVDYITKPFNMAELLMRVKTHIELKQARDKILAYNQELKELNEEKNEFLGIASHDLKNPLTVILMQADTIAHDPECAPALQERGEEIVHSAQRMMDIIRNLLDINRLESGRLEPESELFDVHELISELVWQKETLAQAKQIQLEWQPLDELLLVQTDWQLFQQIIENLLSNAIKYSPLGSTVRIGLESEADSVTCFIADQGPGFSQADQAKMYKKFARLSARPTAGEHSNGLGLSIVHKLAGLLGAKIRCETSPGQGSCFYISLPKLQDALPELDI